MESPSTSEVMNISDEDFFDLLLMDDLIDEHQEERQSENTQVNTTSINQSATIAPTHTTQNTNIKAEEIYFNVKESFTFAKLNESITKVGLKYIKPMILNLLVQLNDEELNQQSYRNSFRSCAEGILYYNHIFVLRLNELSMYYDFLHIKQFAEIIIDLYVRMCDTMICFYKEEYKMIQENFHVGMTTIFQICHNFCMINYKSDVILKLCDSFNSSM